MGTSGLVQSVTVANNGPLPITFRSVTASPADFAPLNSCGSSLAVNSSCSIGVFFDPTAGGTRTGTLTITDNSTGSPQTVTLTGTGQDFSMTLGSAASATISAGRTATYSIAVARAGGFAQSVSLSCSGRPAMSTCSVSRNSIALSGTSPKMATVTVITVAQGSLPPFGTSKPIRLLRQTPQILSQTAILLLALSAFFWLRRQQRPRWARLHAMALLVCVLGMPLTSCGGGSAGGGGGNGGTQAGTYTITVIGNFSSGSTNLTRTAKLTLVEAPPLVR